MNKNEFEELAQSARSANLIDYFRQSGYTMQKHGSEYYVAEYPGLCVNEMTEEWYNHYESCGGRNAVDCLVKTCGRDFKQAVYELTGREIGNSSHQLSQESAKKLLGIERGYVKFSGSGFKKNSKETAPKIKEKKDLSMPERAENMRRVFAYFCKQRKIPADIVEELAHAKLLYQSQSEIKTTVNGIPQNFKTCNAVFVHKNENGVAIGGEVQGVNSYKRFKGIVDGTGDSVFSFIPCPAKDGKIKVSYLFESAIDLMSFYAFCKKDKMDGVELISMAGLKPTVPQQRIEDGVKVLSCVDNDEKGRKFERDNGFKRGADLLEKAGVKDWNELLVMKIEKPEMVKDFVPEIEKKKIFSGRKGQ